MSLAKIINNDVQEEFDEASVPDSLFGSSKHTDDYDNNVQQLFGGGKYAGNKASVKHEPFNMENEQALIAAFLKEPSAVHGLCDAHHFHHVDHQKIWTCMNEVFAELKLLDAVLLQDRLSIKYNLDRLDYIAELLSLDVPVSNVDGYVHVLKSHYYSRIAVKASDEMKTLATSSLDVAEKNSKVHEMMQNLEANLPQKSKLKPMHLLMLNKADHMEAMASGQVNPIHTSWTELDDILNGMLPGELIVVAGRPAMGKTAFALNIAENVAVNYGHAIDIFSLEMKSIELAGRLACSMASIDSYKLRNGALNEDEWSCYASAIERTVSLKIEVDETSAVDCVYIRNALRAKQREGKLPNLIIIDYLQIMKRPASQDMRQFIADTTRDLKEIAKEFNLTVIALSQISRDVEKRADKRPTPADLKESGSIEQDADIIILLYRDEVYNPDSEMKGVAEVIVGKHRSGAAGVARLEYVGKYSRFASIDKYSSTTDGFGEWRPV